MENIFIRVMSIVLSIMLSLFNTLSSVFPGIFPVMPIENTYEICESEQFNIVDDKESEIIVSDYVSWYTLADRESEISRKYDWKYFFTGSLAVITLVLPDPGYELEIVSVSENGDTLDVNYKTTSGDGEYASVLVSKVIVVQISKNISSINLKTVSDPELPEEPEVPEIPDLPELNGFTYGFFDSGNFDGFLYNGSSDVIKDYNEWSTYYVGSDPNLNKYDEAFFAEKNLAIVHIEVPADGKVVQLIDIEEGSGGRLNVNFRVKNGGDYNQGFVSAVIETNKNSSYVYIRETGIRGEYVLEDAEFFLQREIGLPKEDGAYKIITYSTEYYRHITEDYLYLNKYSFPSSFFEDSNLALIYIMLPNMNGYYDFEVNMLSREEDGNTLNIEYATVFEDVDEEDKGEAVKFFVMLVEIPKNITEINAVEKSFKNIYKTFEPFPNFVGMTENPQLVSDYETWSKVCSSDLPYFDKYNEEYFENYSVALIYEIMPDGGSFFDVIKMKENRETFELIYGISGYGGTSAIEYGVLVVEVSKDIKKISVQRKDLDYNYSDGEGFTLDADSAILISDYSQWQTHSASTDSDYSKYDEAYFEDHSLVVVKSANPGGECISIMRYLCEEDGVLNVGVCKHIYPGVGGLAVIWYQVYVIEVDKTVTDVNLEMFY